MQPKYEEDFYGWAIANALLLKQGKLKEADMEHIIEELEEMGRSEKGQLINRLSILIAHLLKWQLQPDFRGRSWSGTIKEQRYKIERLVQENPSLKSKISQAMQEGFLDSKAIIEKETPIDLKLLPSECPYTFEQCLDDEFFPE
jgi:hypothetical protein